jgi:hypothetical protein
VDIAKFLLPFVVILAVCIIVMLLAIVVRCIRERRKLMKSRLSKRKLKLIPTKKFKKGDDADTCPICLDDYIEGDKLRVLPCNHMYHCKCIDPWLTKNRKVCPVCKRKVLPNEDDSSSETEDGTSSQISENRPLLASSSSSGGGDGNAVGNSTFYCSFDNLTHSNSSVVRGFVASGSSAASSPSGSPVMSSRVHRLAEQSTSHSMNDPKNKVPPNGGSCDNAGYNSSSSNDEEDPSLDVKTASSKGRKRHRKQNMGKIKRPSMDSTVEIHQQSTAESSEETPNISATSSNTNANTPAVSTVMDRRTASSKREEIV